MMVTFKSALAGRVMVYRGQTAVGLLDFDALDNYRYCPIGAEPISVEEMRQIAAKLVELNEVREGV